MTPLSACHALMSTQEAAVAEVAAVFQMIADESTLSEANRSRPTPLKSRMPGARATNSGVLRES